MLTVVTFLWFDPDGRHNHLFVYSADYVNRLRSMLERNLSLSHELVCVTDMPEGIDSRVRVVPLPDEVKGWPGCFQRLILFEQDAAETFGNRILLLDLDCVIKAPIDGLLNTDVPFKAWEPRLFYHFDGKYSRYNMSMVLMDAGAHPEVWERFSLDVATKELTEVGLAVDDQTWVSHVLGPDKPVWHWDGDVRSLNATSHPEKARIVFFNGPRSPAMAELQEKHRWIKNHWV